MESGVVNAAGAIVHPAVIDIPRPVLMHDFAVTEHFTIFMDLPWVFDLQRAMQGQPPLYFAPDFGARFGVLPRYGDNSQVKWFTAPACYVFHTLCAYEEADDVVLVACRSPRSPRNPWRLAMTTPAPAARQMRPLCMSGV